MRNWPMVAVPLLFVLIASGCNQQEPAADPPAQKKPPVAKQDAPANQDLPAKVDPTPKANGAPEKAAGESKGDKSSLKALGNAFRRAFDKTAAGEEPDAQP